MSRPISRGGHPPKSHASKGPIEWGSVHITNGNGPPSSVAIQQHVAHALSRAVNDSNPGLQSIYSDSPPPVKYAALGSRTVSDVRGSQFRMPNLQQTACASCEEMAKQLKNLKAKLDQMKQGRQDIERLAHVRVRESESALADLLQENTMLRDALDKRSSGAADAADMEKERLDREELERLKKQLHAAEQEIQYYKEEFERWRRQAASVEDRLVATSSALQERTIAAQKFEERVAALESELASLRAAAASIVPAASPCKDLRDELATAISERDAALQRSLSLGAEVEELKRALAAQREQSEAAAAAAKIEADKERAQLESDIVVCRQQCVDVKAAADASVATAESNAKIAKGQRDELESDLKDVKRVAQTTQERQTATIVRLERELEEARHKLDETKMEVQAVQNSHRGEIKKMQDLLKMMQEQLEALQASRSGPVPTKVVVVTPRIFITIPSGQSMEYGTMELPPRVIRQLVTQQLGYEPLEIIQAKSMEEVHEIKKKL